MNLEKAVTQVIAHRLDPEIITALSEVFFKIMQENGICQHTPAKDGGMAGSNPEWVACWELFLSRVGDQLDLALLFDKVPNDVLCYEKEVEK